MKYALAALLLAGCATAPLPAPYSQSLQRPHVIGVDPDKMAYKADTVDYWDTTQPKAGDCEDYALGWARKLGGGGVIVLTPARNGEPHAVLYRAGKVYDVRHEMTTTDIQPGMVECNLGTGQLGMLDGGRNPVDFGHDEPMSRIARNCARAAWELK